ncbi:hypothetical protein SISSUDRAFT_1059373 [Sistotremastrum suecicum HHB10207 ss-3]|uniref:Uncharacterized protein n=1 Tax=Sistotremastrum suecicum HHB10207 ss-3 TaxID=1314776 RepID=A0A166G8V6_9AGAM|nr:hypothetical protein SISSUDRAFT_1059373 [Sistotremastrum suecicum HHB10207 ss-3]
MRRVGYLFSFLAVVGALVLTVISQTEPHWLHVKTPSGLPATISVGYGLYQRCERQTMSDLPPWTSPKKGNGRYENYECHRFPGRSECDHDNGAFCALWDTAGYASQISLGFIVAALLALTVGGMTRERRRSQWKFVAALMFCHSVLQILTMSLVVHLWRTWDYPPFEYTNLSVSFYLNLASWAFSLVIVGALIITGIAADAGHKWAAGNRAYRPIGG